MRWENQCEIETGSGAGACMASADRRLPLRHDRRGLRRGALWHREVEGWPFGQPGHLGAQALHGRGVNVRHRALTPLLHPGEDAAARDLLGSEAQRRPEPSALRPGCHGDMIGAHLVVGERRMAVPQLRAPPVRTSPRTTRPRSTRSAAWAARSCAARRGGPRSRCRR